MITCRELCELLIDFVSDELPEEQRERIKQHLGKCPPCVAYFESYQITIKLTRQLPCAPMPPQLVERLRAALEEIRKEKQ
ncbi:MAG: zf-HC2 domain-containing protein [Gemmataceae bacterium]|nr:zf-HC2 domain-containing protein [Gemmataceae bacterium]